MVEEKVIENAKALSDSIMQAMSKLGKERFTALVSKYRNILITWLHRGDYWKAPDPMDLSNWGYASMRLNRFLRGKLPWANRELALVRQSFPGFPGYACEYIKDDNFGLLEGSGVDTVQDFMNVVNMDPSGLMNEINSDKPHRALLASIMVEEYGNGN